jgi:flavorubredoxin
LRKGTHVKEVFKAAQVADGVHWVGAIDWAVRDFHGYLTSGGTTYNAYLIRADKVALVDAVKAPFTDELLARIASILPPEKIDYVVSNHSEPDHTGGLAKVIAAVKPEKVFASKMGVKALAAEFGLDCVEAVEDGQAIDLGGMKLTCHETMMCHWPDSMVGYLHERELLFSQDVFGMHLASYERFADELDASLVASENAKYYANILLPLSAPVTKAVDKLAGLGVPFSIIAPDHGPIFRRDTDAVVSRYAQWARQRRTNKAVVLYDTMWGSTELMARAVGEGLAAGGARARLMPLKSCHRSDVATELLDAGALVVGTPTLNAKMYPTLGDALTYLAGLRPKGLVGGAFGSAGWSKSGTTQLQKILEEMQVELVAPPVSVTYAPKAEDLLQCYGLGKQIAARIT